MDFDMTPEQELIIQNVRRFVREEIIPLEEDMDPDASGPEPEDLERLKNQVRDMGLYGLGIPPEFGGPDIGIVTQTLMAIEMSQHRTGLYSPCFGAFGGAGLAQLFEATEDQKERYLYPVLKGDKHGFFGLTEPSGGSDPARAIQTRAVKDGDDWILNGAKIFISGADKADFGILFARTDPEKGRAGITCFLVDTDMPGFHVRRVVHTLRSTHYATEIQIDNLRIPAANVLGEVNKGFGIANDRLSRQRIPYAAGCIGVAIKAQEMAIDYVKIRETFGAPLATRQSIQWMIVDNEIDIRTSRFVTLDAASRSEKGESFRTEAAMAKLLASEAGGRVVDRVMQIHGGYGMTKDLPLERWFREMRIRRIGEGPSEVQRLVMARDIIGGSFH
ncbi:MAG: acyl-CoA dehydrogenase family protein [Pseudomonadales bacterium]|nr:acyl-CoA dehydrogenase family protein [Pseudomonadales bacterium]